MWLLLRIYELMRFCTSKTGVFFGNAVRCYRFFTKRVQKLAGMVVFMLGREGGATYTSASAGQKILMPCGWHLMSSSAGISTGSPSRCITPGALR